MVALIASILLTVGLTLVIIPYSKRRPVGTPVTWGEAMVASVYVFGITLLAYGIVPHQWLLFAESELSWRADQILLGPGGDFPYGPIAVTFRALKDIVATIIYVVFFGSHIAMWAVWQGRGKAKPKEIPTSAYGRPLVKKA